MGGTDTCIPNQQAKVETGILIAIGITLGSIFIILISCCAYKIRNRCIDCFPIGPPKHTTGNRQTVKKDVGHHFIGAIGDQTVQLIIPNQLGWRIYEKS